MVHGVKGSPFSIQCRSPYQADQVLSVGASISGRGIFSVRMVEISHLLGFGALEGFGACWGLGF